VVIEHSVDLKVDGYSRRRSRRVIANASQLTGRDYLLSIGM
jgi:hypothetical protein